MASVPSLLEGDEFIGPREVHDRRPPQNKLKAKDLVCVRHGDIYIATLFTHSEIYRVKWDGELEGHKIDNETPTEYQWNPEPKQRKRKRESSVDDEAKKPKTDAPDLPEGNFYATTPTVLDECPLMPEREHLTVVGIGDKYIAAVVTRDKVFRARWEDPIDDFEIDNVVPAPFYEFLMPPPPPSPPKLPLPTEMSKQVVQQVLNPFDGTPTKEHLTVDRQMWKMMAMPETKRAFRQQLKDRSPTCILSRLMGGMDISTIPEDVEEAKNHPAFVLVALACLLTE